MIRAQESSFIARLSHLNLNSLHWDGRWDCERQRQNEFKMCRLGSWSWTFPPSEITWNHHHHFLSFSPNVDQPNIQNEPLGNCDTRRSRDQPSLLIMVVGTEERWGERSDPDNHPAERSLLSLQGVASKRCGLLMPGSLTQAWPWRLRTDGR